MTAREFLAVAVMLSTNYDERMAHAARQEMENASCPEESREFWRKHYEEDLESIGAKRVLWLEAQP